MRFPSLDTVGALWYHPSRNRARGRSFVRRPIPLTPIIDVHAHVYPEAIAVHAAESIGRFYGGYPMRYDGQLSTLLAGMRRAGIGRALVSSVATTPHQVSSINRFLADAANAHPGHITALGAM